MNNQYDLYNAQSGSWIIPLPWRHTLTFFGSYFAKPARYRQRPLH